MFDIYQISMKTGMMEYINSYATAQEAVKKIASFYVADGVAHRTGDFYYYMQEDKT